ncbi:MAG TPA: hypothetical protein VGO62_07130, partial [Myxococcota bacterium]
MVSALALAALLGTVAAPGPAPAPPPAAPLGSLDASRILVVGDDGTDPARMEEIYSGLRAAGLLPVELDERAGVDRALTAPPDVGAHDEARAHLQEARARFRDLELDATREAADAAVAEVLRLASPEDAVDVLIDALILKASVALQAGLDDEAKSDLALVSRLDPARSELNAGLYPPSLCEAYVDARAAARAAPSAALVVRPRVAGFHRAAVLIDGAPPPALLGAGPHLVTVRAAGMVSYARLVSLDAKEPTVLAPFLAPADAAPRRRALVVAARAAVDDAARAQSLAALADLSAA